VFFFLFVYVEAGVGSWELGVERRRPRNNQGTKDKLLGPGH